MPDVICSLIWGILRESYELTEFIEAFTKAKQTTQNALLNSAKVMLPSTDCMYCYPHLWSISVTLKKAYQDSGKPYFQSVGTLWTRLLLIVRNLSIYFF